MRASAAAAGSTLAALALVLVVGPHAWAESDCQLALEKWAKLSSTRIVPQSSDARGACIPTEAVRNELLDGLARARGVCAEASSDQSLQQQARNLLSINRSFIASLVVCPSSDSADVGDSWAAKSKPSLEKPEVSPPPPAPPKPAVAAPLPAPPKPAVPPPTAPCLEMSPAQNDSYALVNRRCRGHTVLVVIETRGTGGETACKGYAISQSLAVRSPGATPPRLNYECVLSQGPCNKDRLGDMFPECDW